MKKQCPLTYVTESVQDWYIVNTWIHPDIRPLDKRLTIVQIKQLLRNLVRYSPFTKYRNFDK